LPAAYPLVLRRNVVAAYEAGHGSFKQVAEQFGIGEATVNRFVSLARKAGTLQPKTRASRQPLISGKPLEYILKLVDEEPEWTTQELADDLKDAFDLKVSRQTVGAALRRAGYSRKRGSRDRHEHSGRK
jgi:transposase